MSRTNRDDNNVLLAPKRWYRRRRTGLIIAAAFAFVALLGIDALRRERLLHPRPFLILKGYASEIFTSTFSPNGRFVITTNRAGITRILDSQSGQLLHLLQAQPDGISYAKFSPDSKRVVTAADVAIAPTVNPRCVLFQHD